MASGLVFVLFCFVLKKAREKSSPSSQPPQALRPAPGVSSPSSQLQQPSFQNKGALPLPCTQGPALLWDKEGLLPSALSFSTKWPVLGLHLCLPARPQDCNRLSPSACARTHARPYTATHAYLRTLPHIPTRAHARHTHSMRRRAPPSRGNPFSSGLRRLLSGSPLLPSLPAAGSASLDPPFPAELCLAVRPDGFPHTEEARVCRHLLPKLPLGLHQHPPPPTPSRSVPWP